MVIAKFGGGSTHNTTGNLYKMSSFLPEQDLRDVLSKEDYIFLIDEINRRLETEISNLRQYVHTGHKIEIRKRPLLQDAEVILHHIDRTLQIPTTSGVPELSEKFSEYPLSTLREHVVVIRDFLSLP